ncbi:acyl-ACP--UDP-N-acetylglucosamine O-acyltransferase [candidate division WOR-3 bacterium]|nr:acyl-ACP--UDP-N-acetylglucosamine O-acyltransferase [candidate division WOR-3 bacterium]
MKIHEKAIVSKEAKLGKNVIVSPFTVIHENVEIGEGTQIGTCSEIMPNTKIGSFCRIGKGCLVGGDPQHLKDPGEGCLTFIGDKTVLREYVTVHRGTKLGHGKTVIGSGCFIMGFVHIAHDCILGDNITIANESALSGHITVEDNVFISGLCPIHQFTRIGRFSFVGGGYRINKDVLPYGKAVGEPIGMMGLNLVALKRANFSQKAISSLKKAYSLLFSGKIPLFDDRVRAIEGECEDTQEVRHLLAFLRGESKMGLAGRARRR